MEDRDINKKDKSDMKFSDIMNTEASGVEKFNHSADSTDVALNINSERKEAISMVGFEAQRIGCVSKAIEYILTSDKLHNTKERIMASYFVGSYLEHMRGADIIMKLMRSMG